MATVSDNSEGGSFFFSYRFTSYFRGLVVPKLVSPIDQSDFFTIFMPS